MIADVLTLSGSISIRSPNTSRDWGFLFLIERYKASNAKQMLMEQRNESEINVHGPAYEPA
jgi:hypothetical protein